MLNQDQMRIALLAAIVNKNPNNSCVKPKWMGTKAPFVSYETVKGADLAYNVSDPLHMPHKMELMQSGKAMLPLGKPTRIAAHMGNLNICSIKELNEICGSETGSEPYFRAANKLLGSIASTEDSVICTALNRGIYAIDPFASDGSTFFSHTPKKVGNLQPFRNHFMGSLTVNTLKKLIVESTQIKHEDGTSFKVQMNTLIVAPELFAAAMQASQVENIVYAGKDETAEIGTNWIAVGRTIHQIIVMPIDPRTWYLCEAFDGTRQLNALSLIVNPAFEVDSYASEVCRRVGVAYGLSPLIMRCDTSEPSIRQQLEAFLAGRDLGATAAELESYFQST